MYLERLYTRTFDEYFQEGSWSPVSTAEGVQPVIGAIDGENQCAPEAIDGRYESIVSTSLLAGQPDTDTNTRDVVMGDHAAVGNEFSEDFVPYPIPTRVSVTTSSRCENVMPTGSQVTPQHTNVGHPTESSPEIILGRLDNGLNSGGSTQENVLLTIGKGYITATNQQLDYVYRTADFQGDAMCL